MATDPPDSAAIDSAVAHAYSRHRQNSRGRNAKYIPALADVDPRLFAHLRDDSRRPHTAIGDVDHEFPIESISKVFTLALVIEERGHRAVRAKLGANPTGAAFDSVLALELHHDKPTSPLVNAGAMATTSFVPAATQPVVGAKSWISRAPSRGARCRSARRSMLPSRRPTPTTRPLPGCCTARERFSAIR